MTEFALKLLFVPALRAFRKSLWFKRGCFRIVKKRTVVKLTSTFVLTHVPFPGESQSEFENYQTDNERGAGYRVIYGKIPISSV